MGFSTKFSLIYLTFLTIQSSVPILNAKSLPTGEVKFENSNATEGTLTIIPRQDENTDTREYENVPRVVASVSKIFKGVVSGNVHDIFHGAFSFAPVDVSHRLISVYNQVVGFPLRTTEEPPETSPKSNSTRIASSGNNSTEVLSELSESQELPEDEEDDEDDEYEEEDGRRRRRKEEDSNKTKVPPPVTEAVTQKTPPK